jgi:16S rRNA (guanine527-N7)-methyltransferase
VQGEPTPARVLAAREALRSGAAALGLELSAAQLDRFAQYAALLREGKQRLSLTALVDPLDIAQKHFLDSLSAVPHLPPQALRLVDVGTGAGFPGLPLLLVRPQDQALLLEATARKADWVAQTAAQLHLRGATVLPSRAEDAAHDPAHRARYDLSLARAVAPLATLAELCLPFLRPGGRFIAYKSAAGATTEVPQAARAIALLGGAPPVVRPVDLPELPNRVLVLVDQERPAPARYPRRPGMPAKRPL